MGEVKNNIILIDYENLYNSGAQNHQLKMTDVGFEKIVSHYADKYNVNDKMVLVACHFEGYEGLSNLVEELGYTPIRTLELDDNMTDGYLIAYGMKEILENKDTIDQVILIAGDGIYTGLVRIASNLFEKVIVVSWGNSLSKHLTRVSRKKVEIERIEESFDIQQKKDDGWFEDYALSGEEREIISFLLKAERQNGFQLDALANTILKWTDSLVLTKFEDFYKIRTFLHECATNTSFLTKERAPSPRGDKEVWWVKLKRDHTKVKHVIEDNKISEA